MLIAPSGEHLTLAFGSGVGPGDPHDVPHAKHFELADLAGGLIVVGESAADELVILSTRRVRKHRDLRRDAALNEVGSLERPGAAGVKGYDDDVGRCDRFSGDERPTCGPQDRFTNGRNGNDDSRN